MSDDLPKAHARFRAFHERFPLPEDKFTALKEDIVRTKQVRDPLVTWKGCLVDGYTRAEIIESEGINIWSSEALDPDWSEDRVYEWVIVNQCARRNLTEQQMELVWGERYNLEKAKDHTENLPVTTGDVEPSGKNYRLGETPGKTQKTTNGTGKKRGRPKTSERIAKEAGKSEKTVRTWGKHQQIFESLPSLVQRAVTKSPKKLTDSQWKALDRCEGIEGVERALRVGQADNLATAYKVATGKEFAGMKSKPKQKGESEQTQDDGPLTEIQIVKQIDGIRKSIVKHRAAMGLWTEAGLKLPEVKQIRLIMAALDIHVYQPLGQLEEALKK